MYQTLYILRKRGLTGNSVVNIGQQFAIGANEYDILHSLAKFIELKNVDFVNHALKNKPQVIAQLIDGYFANISSLDNFEWIAHYKKLRARSIEVYGVEWTQSDALQNMKNQFQEMFQKTLPTPSPSLTYGDEAFEVLWNSPVFNRSSLWNPEDYETLTKAIAKSDFIDWINSQDEKFFKFIKTE